MKENVGNTGSEKERIVRGENIQESIKKRERKE